MCGHGDGKWSQCLLLHVATVMPGNNGYFQACAVTVEGGTEDQFCFESVAEGIFGWDGHARECLQHRALSGRPVATDNDLGKVDVVSHPPQA